MRSYCLVVLTIGSVAFAQRPVPSYINEFFDKQLAEYSRFSGTKNWTLPAGTTHGMKFSEGTIHFVNTVKRIGDGLIIEDKTKRTVHYRYKIGLEKLAFSFGKVTLDSGKELQGLTIHVKGGNSILYHFTVSKNGASFKVKVDECKFNSLEGLTVEGATTNPDEIATIKTALMEHVNTDLKSNLQGAKQIFR